MPTFADLGIPFPLFEASVDEASEYRGPGHCAVCRLAAAHTFKLGIGCTLVVDCPACQTANGLDAYGRSAQRCRSCGAPVPFPGLPTEEVRVCYHCLRTGKAAITKDTRYGMVRWEETLSGVTHGLPALQTTDVEPVELESGWVGVRMPVSQMHELLRTPSFLTIQGEIWELCCQQPMVYLGPWERPEFTQRAPDGNGKAYFESIVRDCVPGLWEDELHDFTSVYVFRCSRCGKLAAYWDMF